MQGELRFLRLDVGIVINLWTFPRTCLCSAGKRQGMSFRSAQESGINLCASTHESNGRYLRDGHRERRAFGSWRFALCRCCALAPPRRLRKPRNQDGGAIPVFAILAFGLATSIRTVQALATAPFLILFILVIILLASRTHRSIKKSRVIRNSSIL